MRSLSSSKQQQMMIKHENTCKYQAVKVRHVMTIAVDNGKCGSILTQ